MLDAMRSRAGGWVAKIFIVLLAASFGVWGVADVFRGYQGDVLVTVGDIEITAEEYRDVFNRQLRAVSRQLGQPISPQQARQMGFGEQILSQLIGDAAFTAQARALGLAVPDHAIASEIAGNPAFQNAQGEFNPQDFRRLLTQSGISEGEYIALERRDMLTGAISEALDRGLKAPQPLVQALWQHRSERRDAQYFEVRADDVTIPQPSDAELRQFYDDNPSPFQVPERREIALIHADPVELGARAEVAEEDIDAAYERRKGTFGTPERRVIQLIPFADAEEARVALERIRGGAQFLAIASEKGLSEDDATLGELTRDGVPDPAFAEAAFGLAAGTVSEPIEGRLSTALLRVTEVIPAQQQPLAEVRDELARQLRLERGREEALDIFDKVEDGRLTGQSFEDIATTLDLEVRNLEVDRSGLDPEGRTTDLPAKDEVLRTVFDLDIGIEADPVSTEDEGFVWVDVRNITPATVKRFEDAKDDALAAWKSRKTSQAVLERARELKQQAESGAALDELARQVGAEIRSVTDIARGTASENFDAPAVQALFAAAEGGYAVALQDGGASAKVIKSSAVLGPPFDASSAEAKAIAEAIETGLGDDLTLQYSAALQSSLKVELNEALWQQLAAGRI
ncbi:MAG TPA: SurA N-terminal domain-containing protein [Aestuariivirgaceae bacterium]|nr:SurA N-terminal domain-containing protein [Aestuariivirgaceae bacterium]